MQLEKHHSDFFASRVITGIQTQVSPFDFCQRLPCTGYQVLPGIPSQHRRRPAINARGCRCLHHRRSGKSALPDDGESLACVVGDIVAMATAKLSFDYCAVLPIHDSLGVFDNLAIVYRNAEILPREDKRSRVAIGQIIEFVQGDPLPYGDST